jgi:protein-S-isoprenylcysteine O-methyltransferase Ste14
MERKNRDVDATGADRVPPGSAGIIAPPPLLYLGALIGGLVVQATAPFPITSSGPMSWIPGLVLLLAGAALARWAFVTMRRIGTSANPRERSSALATNGPFRLSRNPIYVAMTSLYLGAALVGNSWWPLLLLVPLVLVMHWGVILREERYLEAQFGEAYRRYKSVVRRWL